MYSESLSLLASQKNIIYGKSNDTLISHLFLNCRMNTETNGSTMGVNPIFYQLFTVFELIFIFFYYEMIKRTDGSAMGVKPIFIGFP
jgi:hypothetical protein